jgi:hypothetical protein
MLPDENPMAFVALHDALLAEFAPGTPYETALAENLIGLEWEGIRHRRMRDNLMRSSYRSAAVLAFVGEDVRTKLWGFKGPEKAEDLARDLIGDNDAAREIAEKQLLKCGYTPSDILSVSFVHALNGIEYHERKLADIESRRRRLFEDLGRLQHVRKRRFEDAEVIES